MPVWPRSGLRMTRLDWPKSTVRRRGAWKWRTKRDDEVQAAKNKQDGSGGRLVCWAPPQSSELHEKFSGVKTPVLPYTPGQNPYPFPLPETHGEGAVPFPFQH